MSLQSENTLTQGNNRGRSVDNSYFDLPRPKKSRTSFIRRPKEVKKANDWHLSKEKVPKDAENTKLAFQLHIRILWGLPHQKAVPPNIAVEDTALFTRRFSNEGNVRGAVTTRITQSPSDVDDAQAADAVRNLLEALPSGSITSNNIKPMDERHLKFTFGTVARLGLQGWAPDILNSGPTSMYNLLHEHVAISTFQQVSAAFGYSHLRNNLAVIHDFHLMCKLYRNFVYCSMHKIAKSEAKKPGSVAKSKEMTNVWKRRTELKETRVDIIRDAGFANRVVYLAHETEAHSDDELSDEDANMDDNDDDIAYCIKEKEGRSLNAKRFYRLLDVKHYQKALANGHHRRLPRRRKDPPIPVISEVKARPQKVPVDWFNPIYWNTALTPPERAKYIENGVVISLPLRQ